MKKVIMIPEQPKEEKKPVEFTHFLDGDHGWTRIDTKPSMYEKIIYLGKCNKDGDMFAVYSAYDEIIIFKGHLNSGEY